ncbi:TPA: hypothetical protein EYP66_25940 [Candidatus Poribacteria bacterium]|nr:hypothetical protein [Candidatus Poribacteria bacterium]
MSKKLAVMVFLTLNLVIISWLLASAAADEKTDIDREVQIHELREKIQELESALEERERELVELTARLEHKRADMEREREKERPKLVMISLKHADALNLEEIIAKFLTPSGIIAADPDSNSLVIKDLPEGVETALKIIRELDVPR